MLRSIHAHLFVSALGVVLIAACDGAFIAQDDDLGPAEARPGPTDAAMLTPFTDAGDDPAQVDAAVDGCTRRCDGRSCGDDQCGGVCGVCSENQACNASGRCDNVSVECPLSEETLTRSYPAVWSEGQCIVRWACTDCGEDNGATMRAHYHQPGNLLYAKKHRIAGAESFVSGGFLKNLGVAPEQSIAFCESAPSGSSCERLQVPDCGPYQALSSCSTLFNWIYDNRPVRLRRTGTKLWAESQEPDSGLWRFEQASWLDATGGFGTPYVGHFCFEKSKPAGTPEACP